jgi:sugar phosphate isomerase/epimerase
MIKIGASTYSFKRFDFAGPEEAKWTLEDIIRQSHAYGLQGIEILTNELTSDSHEYLINIKKLAKENDLELYAMAVLNNFIHPDELVREKEVMQVKHWIKTAAFRL